MKLTVPELGVADKLVQVGITTRTLVGSVSFTLPPLSTPIPVTLAVFV